MLGRNLIVFLFALSACSSAPLAEPERTPSSVGPMEYAAGKLREKGIQESFLRLVQDHYRENERARVLDLNLLGFLKDRPESDPRIPRWELGKVEKFMQHHGRAFREVEKTFPVPKEVIASLLWVETKYGRDIGRFHVASSFLSLVQADYPTIMDQTLDVVQSRTRLTPEIEAKVVERSKAKSNWAARELLALQEVHLRGYKDATTLEGSFSGAFGMAQFLPSSYLTWAKGRDKQPNLFSADDSIFSVANYLSVNGWNKKDRTTQEAALFHYNRDKNYVSRILRMSDCLRKNKKKQRVTAGNKRFC